MRQTNTISFDDQYEDRHTAVVAYPEELVFADSAKCPVEVQLFDADASPEYNQEVMLTVKDSSEDDGYSEVRILDGQGRASFDIARYVQMILGDPDDDGTFDYSNDSEIVTQKVIQVSLTAFGVVFYTFTFSAVHGDNKVLDRWWSKPRKLRWWVNYPFAFDAMPIQTSVTDEAGNVTAWTPSDLPLPLPLYQRIRANASTMSNGSFKAHVSKGGIMFGIATASDTGHVAGTKLFMTGDNDVEVIADKCPADPNAAYLRWLDRHCELRHWLFSKYRETDNVQATDDRRSGFDPDRFVDGVARDGRMRDGILTKELTVNTGYLQGWEYDIVESIANAPFVDMLDMEAYLADDTILWHRLMVKPGSYTKALRNSHANDHNLQLAVTLQYDGERSVGV